MPTATTTLERTKLSPPSAILLKSMSSTVDFKSLRSLYHRAARAFLNHDIPLAHSLLDSAFYSLENTQTTIPSELLRKWDILRITFETTVYSTSQTGTIPDALKELCVKSPQAFVHDMHRRSLGLFGKVGAVLLPAPVLSTLVYSSLKVECPDIGRTMIEEWLARRGDHISDWSHELEEDGYRKVLELYCLQVLPKLEQWEYATELLEYESELNVKERENLKVSLRSIHSQTLAARLPTSVSLPELPRSYSPAPSSPSSSSSSLSTKSTNTIVPSTPRQNLPSSPSSPSSDRTVTPRASRSNSRTRSRPVHQQQQRSTRPSAVAPSTSSNPHSQPSSSSSSPTSHHVPRSHHPHHPLNPNSLTPLSLPRSYTGTSPLARPASPSTYALIKASLLPYLNLGSTTNKITTFVVFLIIVPALSLLLRIRRRRRLALAGDSAVKSAEMVRQRLSKGQLSFLARIWWELVRAVVDTVKMGGSGLV